MVRKITDLGLVGWTGVLVALAEPSTPTPRLLPGLPGRRLTRGGEVAARFCLPHRVTPFCLFGLTRGQK